MDVEQYVSLLLQDIEPRIRRLMGLYCAPEASGADIAGWFRDVDFEALRPEQSCMASALCAQREFVGVPQELSPRLHGLIRYVRTLNAGMTAGLCALGALYAQAGIPVRLQKDTALRLGYPGLCRRHMWQADAAVSQERYAQAVAIAREGGYTVTESPMSAVVRRKNTECVVLHKTEAPLGENARKVALSGAEFWIPDTQALVVELAEEAFRGLASSAFQAKTVRWIMDLHPLFQTQTVDWEAAAAMAKSRGTGTWVRLALECYDALAPGNIPQGCWEAFAGAQAAAKLAALARKHRERSPKGGKLQQRYWEARLARPDSAGAAMGLFLRGLVRSGIRRLGREG